VTFFAVLFFGTRVARRVRGVFATHHDDDSGNNRGACVGCVESSEHTTGASIGNNRGAFRRLHAPYLKRQTMQWAGSAR